MLIETKSSVRVFVLRDVQKEVGTIITAAYLGQSVTFILSQSLRVRFEASLRNANFETLLLGERSRLWLSETNHADLRVRETSRGYTVVVQNIISTRNLLNHCSLKPKYGSKRVTDKNKKTERGE